MNKIVKKILLILLLIAFTVGIIFVVKALDNSKNNNNKSSRANSEAVADENSEVRKSSEKVTADEKNMINITDKVFISTTNDIYYNLKDYLGKTVKMEGLIYSYEDDEGKICYAVVRNTPGCCGNDGLAGLDIRYDGEYPKKDTWVTIIGVVGKDNVYGEEIPAIQVSSLEKTKEGNTFLNN